jgi:GTP-binding protein
MVLDKVPGPEVQPDAPLQMLVTTLDWSEYVGASPWAASRPARSARARRSTDAGGRAGDDRQDRHAVRVPQPGPPRSRRRRPRATWSPSSAGHVEIGDTICARPSRRPLPRLTVDEPTLEMVFSINNSPFCRARRQIRDDAAVARTAAEGIGTERRAASPAARGLRCVRRLRAAACCIWPC